MTDMLTWLRELASRMDTAGAEEEAVLRDAVDRLKGLAAAYEAPPPAGGGPVHGLMCEAVTLQMAAVNGFLDHLEGRGDDLMTCVQQAEEADDILSALEDAIIQSQEWTGQVTA